MTPAEDGERPARATRRTARSRAALAGGCLMAVGLIVVVLTAADYGVAWDDYVQTRYGELVLNYFMSGGIDRSCNEFLDLKFYAPTFELMAAAANRLAPVRTIELRHILCAVVGLLAVPPLVGFGRLLGRPWLGLTAAVALWLSPVFYGHAFVNTKDIPFAVGWLWSMYALAVMFARGRFSRGDVLRCGLAVGLTVSIRPGGWMLLLPSYAAAAIWSDWRARASGQPKRRSLCKQAGLLAVAWTVMVLPWPWAHENPWSHPLQAIRMASQFHIVVPVLFEGEMIPSDQLPRYYLLTHLLLTTPPAILVLAAVGLAAAAQWAWRRANHPRTMVLVILGIWLALPLSLFVVMRPNAYDGMRHFLFLLPVVALWSAYGCQWLWTKLREGNRRIALIALLVFAVASQVHSLVALHPYQMTYFNLLAGGVGRAVERYDTECWLLSYKEAMDWIQRQPPRRAGEATRVLVAANENSLWCAAAFAGEGIEVTATRLCGQQGDLPAGIDYYVGTCRCSMNKNFPEALIVHQIKRQGAVFATIKRAARRDNIPAISADKLAIELATPQSTPTGSP